MVESFMVMADFDVAEDVGEINVKLSSESYDSLLEKYDLFDGDVNFKGECQIEKELTIPNDAPEGEYYFLQVDYLYKWERSCGYANTVMVSVVSSEDLN
jgi:hypothetical protein